MRAAGRILVRILLVTGVIALWVAWVVVLAIWGG